MIDFLAATKKLTKHQAYQLVSIAGHVAVTQLVDKPNMGVHVKMPKKHLHGAGRQPRPSHAEQEIRALEKRWNDSRVRADVAALDTLLADEWTVTHGDGTIDTKAQYLADLRSGDRKFFGDVKQDEFTVRVHGDTAIVAGHQRFESGIQRPARRRSAAVHARLHEARWTLADGGLASDAAPAVIPVRGSTSIGLALALWSAIAAPVTTAPRHRVRATRLPQNPLITVDSSRSLGDNVNGPSIIRVPSWVQRPLGRSKARRGSSGTPACSRRRGRRSCSIRSAASRGSRPPS